jgi:peptidoglycan/xylan/chitin deacetylase (PgdA/CDA1 family)
MYHRIGSSCWDPWQLCVSPEHFAQHLSVLASKVNVVSLEDLRSQLRTRRQGRPVVALTFDDGYVDNLDVALPLLERYGVPATVFVATACIDRGEPFWWDRLTNIVQSFASVPNEVRLQTSSNEFLWRRASQSGGYINERDNLHLALWSHLVGLEHHERSVALDNLQSHVGGAVQVDSGRRPMTREELRGIAASPLIEVGAHTMNHCSLPGMSPSDRFEEIAGSRKQCERLTGIPPSSFAYPFGRWNHDVSEQVSLAGFSRACVGGDELCWENTDPLVLSRMHVLDYDGNAFDQRLRWAWLP